MNPEIQQLLKNLRLARMLEILDEEIEEATAKDPTYEDFLVRLLRAQWHDRQDKALEYRIRRAKLPFTWTLESFPFKKQPGISRRRITNLASLEFVPRAENIVFMGMSRRKFSCRAGAGERTLWFSGLFGRGPWPLRSEDVVRTQQRPRPRAVGGGRVRQSPTGSSAVNSRAFPVRYSTDSRLYSGSWAWRISAAVR